MSSFTIYTHLYSVSKTKIEKYRSNSAENFRTQQKLTDIFNQVSDSNRSFIFAFYP